eukprot:366537-Chlamydomonas_euryale.AAC.3
MPALAVNLPIHPPLPCLMCVRNSALQGSASALRSLHGCCCDTSQAQSDGLRSHGLGAQGMRPFAS